MYSAATRMNYYLRLFDKRKGIIDDMPVHAAPKVRGSVARLKSPLYHYGETDVHTKIEKINAYSTGLVADKIGKNRWGIGLIMICYPPLFFIRSYLFKRNFLNGWAGFINSVMGRIYQFGNRGFLRLSQVRQVVRTSPVCQVWEAVAARWRATPAGRIPSSCYRYLMPGRWRYPANQAYRSVCSCRCRSTSDGVTIAMQVW